MNSWIYTFSIFISYFVFELYKSRSCIFIRVINSELIKISHSKVKKKTSVWLKEQQSGSGSLGRKLKLLASTLSRVLCYYESNSTIVVARSTRGDTYVGGRGEDAGRLRALVCNARVHWNQRDGGGGDGVRREGIHPRSIPGRRGANCERHTLRGCTRENKGEKKNENKRQWRIQNSGDPSRRVLLASYIV